MAELKGIDVSIHNGILDWKAIKKAGIDFAIIKATQGKLVSNANTKNFTDKQFINNINNAFSANIACGVYHYYTAQSNAEAIEEADYFISVIKPYKSKITLWAAIDVEEDSYLSKLNKTQLTEQVNTFCNRVKAAGFNVCVYTNRNYMTYKLNYANLKQWDMWQAHWSSTKPSDCGDKLVIWQYGIGQLSGIKGQFDMNYGYFELPKTIITSKDTQNNDIKSSESQNTHQFAIGDKVKIIDTQSSGTTKRAKTYTGGSFVIYYDVYDVIAVSGDKITIGIGKVVTANVKSSSIEKISASSSLNTKTNDRYVKDSLTFIKTENFKVTYYDGLKNDYGKSNYINAGFFGVYDNGITLPAANVCSDINLSKLSSIAQHYLKKHVTNNKLKFNCNDNFSNQFKNKKVSTLIVNNAGKIHIGEYTTLPSDCKYAISGVPVIRDGKVVNYINFVKLQGWDSSCMYATYRHFLGIKNNEIWIITGKTTTSNYVSTSEVYNKIKSEGFSDVICLDGGGSYVFVENNNNAKTISENRRINTVIEF